jgi:hypothetical protein
MAVDQRTGCDQLYSTAQGRWVASRKGSCCTYYLSHCSGSEHWAHISGRRNSELLRVKPLLLYSKCGGWNPKWLGVSASWNVGLGCDQLYCRAQDRPAAARERSWCTLYNGTTYLSHCNGSEDRLWSAVQNSPRQASRHKCRIMLYLTHKLFFTRVCFYLKNKCVVQVLMQNFLGAFCIYFWNPYQIPKISLKFPQKIYFGPLCSDPTSHESWPLR